MEFTKLISDFAERHGIANLAAEDSAAALDVEEAPQFGANGFVQV